MSRLVGALFGVGMMALGVLSGCAPGVRITRLAPSTYNLGGSKRLAVLQTRGERNATDGLVTALQSRIVEDGYYQLMLATERGYSFSIDTPAGVVELGEVRRSVDADAYLVASITSFDYREVEKSDGGKRMLQPEGHVTINFQVVTADGRAVVMANYQGDSAGAWFESSQKPSRSRAEALERAMASAINQFTRDITPRQITERIVFDDTDARLKAGIEFAERGDLAGAERAWTALSTQDATLAGAIYNVGVLLELRGEFDQAERSYQQALSIGGPASPRYQSSLDNMRRRLAEAQSLTHKL